MKINAFDYIKLLDLVLCGVEDYLLGVINVVGCGGFIDELFAKGVWLLNCGGFIDELLSNIILNCCGFPDALCTEGYAQYVNTIIASLSACRIKRCRRR